MQPERHSNLIAACVTQSKIAVRPEGGHFTKLLGCTKLGTTWQHTAATGRPLEEELDTYLSSLTSEVSLLPIYLTWQCTSYVRP